MWFLNYYVIKFQEHLALSNKAVLAAQMGHGELMHSLYAGDERLPSGIDFHIFFSSMKTSRIWHELLGFPPTLFHAMNATRPNQKSALLGKQLVSVVMLLLIT